jgi:hypothetical protein
MNACKSLFSGVGISQPEIDNNNQHKIDKILEER